MKNDNLNFVNLGYLVSSMLNEKSCVINIYSPFRKTSVCCFKQTEVIHNPLAFSIGDGWGIKIDFSMDKISDITIAQDYITLKQDYTKYEILIA